YEVARILGGESWGTFLISILVGAVVGALFATLTELLLIRKLYERLIEQVLVTVGLALASVALFEGIWGQDPIYTTGPAWLDQTTNVFGATIPNDRFIYILSAVLVLLAIV